MAKMIILSHFYDFILDLQIFKGKTAIFATFYHFLKLKIAGNETIDQTDSNLAKNPLTTRIL